MAELRTDVHGARQSATATPAGYGPQFVWLDSGVYRRAQGFFYEASTLGNFCAFFLVFCHHMFGQETKATKFLAQFGSLGMCLFFFLSAYLIRELLHSKCRVSD